MRPLFPTVLVLFLASPFNQAAAQDPTGQLRPNIVHVLNENGEDEYRDDRITTIQDTSVCFLYVGRKQSGPLWVRLQVRYSAHKRLNMEKIMFSKDTRQVTINVSPSLLQWGDNGMVYWEWYDAPPGEAERKVVEAIIREPGVVITLIGNKETVSRELSGTERVAMENVLEQARMLGRADQ